MGMFTRFMAFAGFPVESGEPERFVEAAGVTVDADDDQWRRLSGDSQRDLEPLTAQRARELARHVWESNLLGNRLIELPLAYLIAEGVTLRVGDKSLPEQLVEDAQRALDRHWHDPINAWDIKLRRRLRELALYGEWLSVSFVGTDGAVRWGYLAPEEIETVVTDPDNREQPIGIVTRRDKRGVAKRYKVIVAGDDEVLFGEKAQRIRQTMTDGEIYYATVNSLCGGVRGRSDLLAQLDWLDAYDQYLFGELDRAQFLRAWVWDVTIAGATPEEVKERARTISPPKPGTVRVHNDSETWDAKTPELGSHDATTGARMFRTHVLGGASMPEHWYGDAAEVNKSTGDSMAEPTLKMLTARQREAGYYIADMGRYVMLQAHRAKQIRATPEQLAQLLMSVRVDWPDLAAKDASRYAAAFGQVIAGAAAAIVQGLVTRATALRLVASIATGLGVEIDVEAELDAVLKEGEADADDDLPNAGDLDSGDPEDA